MVATKQRFRIERLEERLAPSAFNGCGGGSRKGGSNRGGSHKGGSKCKGGSNKGGSRCKGGSHKGASHKGGSKCKGGSKFKGGSGRCVPRPPVCVTPKTQPCS